MMPAFAPADVGRKRSGSGIASPGATLIGKVSTCGTWKSGDEDEIALTRSGQVPRLSTVIARSLNPFGPVHSSPKSPVSATTVTAVACPTLALSATCSVGKFGSLLVIVKSVVRVPAAVGVNVTSNGKQKSWLIVTGKPDDGDTTANSGFDEVIDATARSPALVLHTFNDPGCLSPRHDAENAGGDGTVISGIATFLNVSRHAPRPRVPR